jgi:ribosomal protein RSM22 (predicted rRNA methylase)
MPYTYSVYKRIFNELKIRLPSFKPESVLDYGAGLGSGLWSTIHMYENDKTIKRVAAVEPNQAMRKLGKFMTEDLLNKEDAPSILWADSLAMIPGYGAERGKFDIIILGYVL